jgi:hypothetical protein
MSSLYEHFKTTQNKIVQKKKKIKKNRRLERPETIIEAPSSLLLEIKALNNYKEENRGMH